MTRIDEPTTRATQWVLRLGLVLVVAAPAIAYSYPSAPNVALPGQVIEASDINDNFEHVVDGITALEQRVVPAGAIVPFGGPTPPPGWLLCDGSEVDRVAYQALFDAIGVAHGVGDGVDTFHLPDYRGRFLRGVDMGIGRDLDAGDRAPSSAGGNAGDAIGSVQEDALIDHDHTVETWFGLNADGSFNQNNAGYGAAGPYGTFPTVDIVAPTDVSAHETRPVNAYVHWIIKT